MQQVIAVSLCATHAFSKQVRPAIRLLKGLGVEGDAHHGVTVKHRSRVRQDPTQPNLRQVHLIHEELHDELRASGFAIGPGTMGENITTRGVDLLGLPTGTRLRLPDAQPGRSLLRYPRTWLLVLFFGLGTACYTCVLAWLAPYYLEQGWSAQESGLLLGFLTAMEVLSGLLAPALASRSRDRRPVLVGLTALMLAGFLGLAWAPASLPLLWALCLGLGIGGLFPMGLIVCLDHFDAPQRAGQLAALVQGAGYLIAGVSPWIAGLLRDSLGSFTGAWLGLATVAALLLGLGLRFDPRRYAALFDERQPQGVGAESLR